MDVNTSLSTAAPGRNRGGFTLIELLVVIAIMAVLMALLVGAGRYARIKALEGRAKADLEQIGMRLNEYQVNNGIYPSSLDDITNALPATIDLKDPWDRPYRYSVSPDGQSFNLYSTGRIDPDPEPGSSDNLLLGR